VFYKTTLFIRDEILLTALDELTAAGVALIADPKKFEME
jgi:hypothetical protein